MLEKQNEIKYPIFDSWDTALNRTPYMFMNSGIPFGDKVLEIHESSYYAPNTRLVLWSLHSFQVRFIEPFYLKYKAMPDEPHHCI